MTTTTVGTRIAAVSLMNCAFEYAFRMEKMNDSDAASGVLLLISFVWFQAFSSPHREGNVVDGGGGSITLDGYSLWLIGFILTPLLVTMTSSYSDDTVDRLTKMFWTVHLYFMDAARVWNSPLSLNCAFASIILLASRLKSNTLSFSYATACTTLLLFTPRSPLLAAALSASATYVCYGWGLTSGYIAILAFVDVLSPRILDHLARTNPRFVRIEGSWDLLRIQAGRRA